MPYDTMSTAWNYAVHALNRGLMIITPDGMIDKINDPLVTMSVRYGVSPEFQWQGASFFDIMPWCFGEVDFGCLDGEHYLSSVRAVLEGSQPDCVLEYSVSRNRKVFWVLCEVQPLSVSSDNFIHGAILSFTDITKYKQRQILLEQTIARSLPLPEHIPICAVCKHVSQEETWEPVESYLESRLPIEFTHDICPECIRRLYPKYSSALDDDPTRETEE